MPKAKKFGDRMRNYPAHLHGKDAQFAKKCFESGLKVITGMISATHDAMALVIPLHLEDECRHVVSLHRLDWRL